jgi:hypothetical protein
MRNSDASISAKLLRIALLSSTNSSLVPGIRILESTPLPRNW